MEVLKAAVDWAKAEIFSAMFFILFGGMFISGAIGFWQLGKTEMAKAFVYPLLGAGILLLAAGVGFTISNKSRISNFESEYKTDASAFIESEVARVEKTMWEYQNIALKVLPILIAVAGLLIAFIDKPIWRAISISMIAMLLCMIWIDGLANSRLIEYHKELISVQEANKD